MLNINKAVIAGSLGADPEIRHTQSGKEVCTIRVATNDYHGSGENREQVTEWHTVVLFGQFAKFAGEHLQKGANVYVEGKTQTRKWIDKSGKEQFTKEIIAQEFQAVTRSGKQDK
ncbi:single-stranded DNA-binding protein [Acidocella facilis]|uniref:single-stranded DNA-binding protein n=1 Tax=Acidocella facilis TaxID=525 RepID=UPI001F447649|nr:single-stranded DNA-binding protein [Acidocella facilis]